VPPDEVPVESDVAVVEEPEEVPVELPPDTPVPVAPEEVVPVAVEPEDEGPPDEVSVEPEATVVEAPEETPPALPPVTSVPPEPEVPAGTLLPVPDPVEAPEAGPSSANATAGARRITTKNSNIKRIVDLGFFDFAINVISLPSKYILKATRIIFYI